MRYDDRYCGPFSETDIGEIQRTLNLSNHEDARQVGLQICGIMMFYALTDEARRVVPDVSAAKNRLSEIAALSKRLSTLLKEEPLSVPVTQRADSCLNGMHEFGLFDTIPIWGDRNISLDQVTNFLARLSFISRKVADNDRLFRKAHLLPKIEDTGKITETYTVWPHLFAIWEKSGRKVSKTPYGPTHRFLMLVHRAFVLPEPNPNTLGKVVARWKRGQRPDKEPKTPAGYFN